VSDRVFAAVWLLFCAGMVWVGWAIQAPFSYEPIGPRAFPLLLAAGMALSAAWILFRPDPEPNWPAGSLRGKTALLVGAFLGYALVFELLGFPISTALVTIVVGRLFGGSWVGVSVGGIAMGAGLWLLFDRLLEVTLPLGRLLGGS